MDHDFLTDASTADDLVSGLNDARQPLLRVSVRRPDDLFVADLTFYNLHVTGSPPVLRRIDSDRSATIVMQLPPQSFGEQALLDATGPEVPAGDDDEFTEKEAQKNEDAGRGDDALKNTGRATAEPIPELGRTKIRIAGPTRLVFRMPSSVASLPYTLSALLNAFTTWPLVRALSARSEPEFGGTSPADFETLDALVKSNDFIIGQGEYLAALRELAAGAEVQVVAAAKRIAAKAAASFKSTKPSTAPPLQALVRSETTALVTGFGALNEARARSLVTMAIAYQATIEMSKLKIVGTPGYEATRTVPLLAQIFAPFRPGSKVTALELPYRLLVSPIGAGRFTHRSTAVARQGRNELWHTRLTDDSGNFGPDSVGQVRAIWSDDYPGDLPPDLTRPFRMPLDAQDRRMLVQLTTGYDEVTKTNAQYNPRAATANRLILSALGGLLDGNGAWGTRPQGVDLEAWRHLMSMGRDHYVRVVYSGFLLPFGHAASLIKVTERKFEGFDQPKALSKRVAVLRQRFFIVVREPIKTFDGSYHATGGHPFPFTSVELLTHVTPNLVAPDNAACKANSDKLYDASFGVTAGGLTPRQLFWPMLTASPKLDFRFDVAAIDRAGQRVTFAMPLLFVSDVANTGDATVSGVKYNRMQSVVKAYNAESGARRLVQVGGVSVCFAPLDSSRDGDPRLPTDSIAFKASDALPISTTRINTYPEVEYATVALRAVQRIMNTGKSMTPVHYPAVYRSQGFGSGNAGEVFLELYPAGTIVDVSFGPGTQASRTDVVGAVASPSMKIQGLSRHTGLVSDLAKVATNRFDPMAYFADARVLGGIKLTDILSGQADVSGSKAPKFTSRELPASGALPARTESRYDWQTELNPRQPDPDPDEPDPKRIILSGADGSNPSSFRLLAITTAPIDSPTSSLSTATATIGNFNVNLLGFIILRFRKLLFTTERGKKPEVDVDLHPTQGVRFGGPLEFVNQLKDLLPGDGFSDPSALQVTASGIQAHYALTVPSVQVGIFALSGLSIGAGFTLPFDNEPMEVGFNFATRDDPFSLTVSLLGGGGFLAIGIGTTGVREIEAALEAGARLAIDLGVASGSVEIKAGIYFHWLEPGGGEPGLVELAGYVRLHGELDVMGIISASLTFNLQLAYTKEGNRSVIWGEATLTIEIEVLVFSGEVTVRCRRNFAGSSADPTFAQLVPGTDTWSNYCSAFAEA